MPLYSIEVVDRETGKSVLLDMEAASERAAKDAMTAQGWIVGEIKPKLPIASTTPQADKGEAQQATRDGVNESILAELREIRELVAPLKELRKDKIRRHIAWGMVRGWVYITLICLAVSALLWLFAILLIIAGALSLPSVP